ncbi:B12-binding domain-containing radical SAM protein [Nanoarchaeota archaeon]
MKKVLLLFPNYANWATISTAIPILAGIAKKRKWKVDYFDTYRYEKIKDSSVEKESAGGFKPGFTKLEEKKQLPHKNILLDFQEKIDEFQPDILAITALSHEYEFLMSFLPEINIPKHTKIIIGGIHATLVADDVLKTKMFDLVAVGQGEKTFEEILERVEENQNLEGIKGTYFFDRNQDKLVRNPRRLLLNAEELWEVEQDFSLFDEDYFIRPFDGKIIKRYDIEAARGCPFNCTYCGNSALKKINEGLGKYVLTRPADSLFGHMKRMIKDYQIDIFQFTDECFLARPASAIKEFMERYVKEIKKPFIFQTRAETINEEKIKILIDSGVPFQVSIGVESGSERILGEICNRKCTANHIINAFDLLHKYRIRCNAFFMVGFPFETREDLFKTIELCRRIKPSVSSVAIFQPLPGQELTRVCMENKFITGKEPMATFTSHSLLKMPPPYMSSEEIRNLWKTFVLYSSLPKEYYSKIEKCEKNYEANKDLFEELIGLRWESYDYAISNDDIKLV